MKIRVALAGFLMLLATVAVAQTVTIQKRTSTLQSQTSTPQWLRSTSQLQQQTSQLQSQTSQLQQQTSQLQQQTSQLQRQTSQLQTQTSQLQQQTSQLQSQISQLQSQTSQLQSQTSQLQSQTSQLQATSVHLQARTRSGTNTYTAWADANSCTYHTGTNYPYTECKYGTTTTTTGVNSCALGTKTTSTSNNTTYNGPTITTACNTVVTSNYAGAQTCNASTTPVGGGYTTQCQTVITSAFTGAPTCNASTTPDGSGYTTQCQTVITSAFGFVSSCAATTPPDNNGYTTQCQTAVKTAYVGAQTCNASSTPDGSGQTTQCQTVVTSNYANVASCNPSSTPGNNGYTTQCRTTVTSPYTGTQTCNPTTTLNVSGQTTQCQTVVTVPYAGTRSCTATSSPTSSNGNTTQCQTVVTVPWAGAQSCSPTSSPTSSNGLTTQCQTVVTSAYAGVPSCSISNTTDSSGYTTQCQTVIASAYANAPTCAATASPDGTGLTTQCQTVVASAYTNAASCTASASPDSNGQTTQCAYTAWSTPVTVSACTAVNPSTASPYTVSAATSCTAATPILGTLSGVSSCTESINTHCQYTAWGGWADATTCTAVPQSTGPNYTVAMAIDCQGIVLTGTLNTLADVAAYYYNTDLRSPDTAKGTGTCIGPVIPPATTPTDLCTDNVPANGRDVATTQHMTTFTLGLGSQGQMIYAPNDGKDYWNDTSGDFFNVRAGTTTNAVTGICSWQTSGSCNWPIPASNSNANIDDLWHAAVNGHGTYFSAKDPSTLAAGLSSTLAIIADVPRPGTAAAAASSNPNVSSSDNYVFSSSYKSVEWYGELIRQQINTAGALTAQNWSAMRLLDCATTPWRAATSYIAGAGYRYGTTCYTVSTAYTSGTLFNDTTGNDLRYSVVVNVDEAATTKVPATALTARTIWTKNGNALVPFTWANLNNTQQAFFKSPALSFVAGTPSTASTGLSQFCASGGNCLSSTAQSNTTLATGGAAGEALINFLRGDRSYEGSYFRNRTHVLGDIVSSEARYVKTPLFNFTDANFSAFKTLMSTRTSMVYVGANDGMLHAFDASTGQEKWAYVPELLLPNLYQLADKNYGSQHQFFVDNTPEVGDICPTAPTSTCTAAQWKSILVGGLNRGGKGFYALDITNPADPKLLWEFTDTNLGYSYGNPRITKLMDGTWVVILASGYNNADGQGRVYVLNANTGTLIRSISNNTGSAAAPSGLAHVAGHVRVPDTDNTTIEVYGGDTLGNLWRFDVNGAPGAIGSNYVAQLLVSLKDASGNAQPITAKPTIASVSVNGTDKPIVMIGTGRYLGTSDVADPSPQTFYAVLDKYTTTAYGNPRTTGNGFVQQTMTATTCPAGSALTVCSPGQVVRTNPTSNAVNWANDNGWYVDFLSAGERSATDSTLGLGSLLFTTIRPQSSSVSACGAEGTDTSASFLYVLNYLTGAAVVGANTVSGVSLGSGIVTRPVMVELSDGTVMALVRTSTGSASTGTDLGYTAVLKPTVNLSSTGNPRRVSWRELPTR